MKKHFLKILIATLILLIGISAVSAIEHNSNDGFLSVEQSDEISVIDDNTGVLSAESSNEVISVSENNGDVLSAESSNEIISVSEDNGDVLSAESSNEVISVSEDNGDVLSAESSNEVISASGDSVLTSSSPFAKEPQGTQKHTEYKTFTLGKVKVHKKYIKFASGYKPSKKNKKAWKLYKSYKKYLKRKQNELKKSITKVAKKAVKNHWHGCSDVWFRYKKSGNFYVYTYYQKAYRTYNYNPLLNKGWWD